MGSLGATWAALKAWALRLELATLSGAGPLTEISRVVVRGAVEAQTLQVGDEIGHDALEDALALAQDVELQEKAGLGQVQGRQGTATRSCPPPCPGGTQGDTGCPRHTPATRAPREMPAAHPSQGLSPGLWGQRDPAPAQTLSNISKSLALGWWMVQMMVRPP